MCGIYEVCDVRVCDLDEGRSFVEVDKIIGL